MQKQPNLIQLVASLIIDYFRWSQLTPLILMWFIVLGMLFVLFFVSHQEQTWSMLGALSDWIASLPWIGPKFIAFLESQAEDGAISPDLGGVDFKTAVLWVWGIISIILMAISWLVGLFVGPFKPWTLKRKLGVAALACALVVVLIMTLYFLDSESWNDTPLAVALSASGIAFFMFLVNLWCLSISHALGIVSKYVAETDFSRQNDAGGVA